MGGCCWHRPRDNSSSGGKVNRAPKTLCQHINSLLVPTLLNHRNIFECHGETQETHPQCGQGQPRGHCFQKKSEVLLVLIQNLPKDHCQIKQTVHKIPAPQPTRPNPSPLVFHPLPLSFDPCPVVTEDKDNTFFDTEPTGGENGGDHIHSCFSPLFSVSDGYGGCS